MIQIQSFTFNPFQENTYLLTDENKNALVIDPGMYGDAELAKMKKHLEDNKLKLTKVVLTHAHLDHVFGLKGLLDSYDVPFFIHEKELPVYQTAETVARNYGVDLKLPTKKHSLISETETLDFGGEELEIRFAPGHSPGSICFHSKENNWLIGGDVIFQQSIGRTDLPGGDTATLLKSIQTQIFTLPDNTTIYSGHGPHTNVGFEKMNNPFFRN